MVTDGCALPNKPSNNAPAESPDAGSEDADVVSALLANGCAVFTTLNMW